MVLVSPIGSVEVDDSSGEKQQAGENKLSTQIGVQCMGKRCLIARPEIRNRGGQKQDGANDKRDGNSIE